MQTIIIFTVSHIIDGLYNSIRNMYIDKKCILFLMFIECIRLVDQQKKQIIKKNPQKEIIGKKMCIIIMY